MTPIIFETETPDPDDFAGGNLVSNPREKFRGRVACLGATPGNAARADSRFLSIQVPKGRS